MENIDVQKPVTEKKVEAKRLRIVAAAFGDPLNEKVQSGEAKSLFGALGKKTDIAALLSTKQIRITDVFDGAVDFSKTFKYGRPGISANWMWQNKTLEKLSARFEQQLDGLDSIDAVVQVGTNICVRRKGVRHFCKTDVTVKQAVSAKQYSVAKLDKKLIDEAIETQRRIFENCDAIFVTSEWVKKSVQNDYGIDADSIYVVGVGSTNHFDLRQGEKVANHKILFVGRDWQRKGGSVLIEAFERVRKVIKDAQLTIIGCKPDIRCEAVTLLGELSQSNPEQGRILEKAYRDSAVLCVPSEFEPFAICFAEAQFSGVVPVTFIGQGRAEIIRDGVTGVLVKEHSAGALSDALIELLLDAERIKQMREAGRDFARENFTWDVVASKMTTVMERYCWA